MTDLLDRPRPGRSGSPRRSVGPGGERPRIDPRIAQRWVEARRQEGRRRLRILIVVAALAGLAGLGIGSLYTPLFALRHLRVAATGAAVVGVGRIETEAGLLHHPLMIDVHPGAIARRLDADPLLGAAKVTKRWPSTVSVSVVERSALAQVAVSKGSTTAYVLVDETGRVLGTAGARIPGLALIQGVGPVPATGGWISGAPGPAAVPGSSPDALVDMNAASDAPDVPRGASVALAVLQALPAGLRPTVQSVTIGGTSGVSLVIAPPRLASSTVQMVLGDGSQLAAKVTALETLVAQASLSGVSSIDLSVPSRPAALTTSGAGAATTGSGSATTGSGSVSGSATSGSATAGGAGSSPSSGSQASG